MGFKDTWARWAKDGLKWPLMHDPVDGKPSVTVMFAYLAFVLAVCSVIALHFFPSIFTATCTAIGLWSVATTFYLIRKLNKAKFDLKNQAFELDGGDDGTGDTSTTVKPSNDDTVGS